MGLGWNEAGDTFPGVKAEYCCCRSCCELLAYGTDELLRGFCGRLCKKVRGFGNTGIDGDYLGRRDETPFGGSIGDTAGDAVAVFGSLGSG